MTVSITPDDIMPFRASETTLANGLRVIVVPTGFPNLVSLQIPVQTGSRNEVEEGRSGFAHFFEHMMFRGTPNWSPEARERLLTRAGARGNAYTTDDYTNYHLTFGNEDLEQILAVEADRFMNLAYAEADFKTEARAVLGEYNKNAADPLTKLMEVQREHAFRVHPYRHTTMGFLADIEAMPGQFAYSRTFFERWYRPEYTTVIVAGDVEPEATLAMVERHWGGWRGGAGEAVAIPAEPPPAGPVTVHVPWTSETLPWVTVGIHGPAFSETSKEYAALDVLLDLSFGETSEVYQRLVEREQVADQLFAYFPSTEDPQLATVMARVKRAEDTPAVRAAILAAFAEARDRGVTEERLREAIANMRYAFARTLDNSESIASTLARFVRFKREYGTVNELFRTYASLTTANLKTAAERYVRDAGLVLTTLSHGELPEAATSLPSLPAPPMSSGTGVEPKWIELRGPSPLLRFKLLFRVGSAHDPAGKEGLAQLAASMVAEAGSERMRVDEINKALFPLAGTFSAQVDREMTVFTGVAHRDNLARFLDIVLPQLLTPGFREEDFSRLREQQKNELLIDLRANNEEELGKERLQENLFLETAYGHPSLGTARGIEAISLDDVKAFVAERFVRTNLTVGLAGAWGDAGLEAVKGRLSELPAGLAAPAPVVAGRMPRRMEIEIVAKEARATAISFGHPIEVTRTHPDFAALWLARAHLGEHRSSHGRLFQRLREVRGLNYGDYAYVEAFPRGMYQFFPDPNLARRAQAFEVWIRPVAPEHAAFALKAALFELRKLIEEGVSGEAFEDMRAYLSKYVYLMTKTQDQQLGFALDDDWYGMGEFVPEMQARLRALTRDQLNAAVRRHLSGERLSVVMVTKDAEGLREALFSGRPAVMRDESSKPPDLLAEDEVIGRLDLGLRPEDVRITRVEDVFA